MIMKIDIYNNPQTFRQEQQQDRSIAAWCRRTGIPLQAIMGHAQQDNVVLLIQIYDEFQAELKINTRLRGVFDAYWGIVFHSKRYLKQKSFKKIQQLVLDCIQTRTEQQAILKTIQNLRQKIGTSPTQSVDHDNQANGSYSPRSHIRLGIHEGSAAEG